MYHHAFTCQSVVLEKGVVPKIGAHFFPVKMFLLLLCVCVCVWGGRACVRAYVRVCVHVLRIVSTGEILCSINTFFYYHLNIITDWCRIPCRVPREYK